MIDYYEFSQKYKQHLEWLNADFPNQTELEKIFKIFSYVSKNGGWARTIGLDQWRNFSDFSESRNFYEKNYLVSFERILKNAWPYTAEITKGIDFSLLQAIPIFTSVRRDEWEELLAEDIAMYRSVYKLGLREDLISLDLIKEKYGDLEITIITQEANTSEFSVKKVTKEIMKLKDYIRMMQISSKKSKLIKFAVNIDIGDWKTEIDEIRKNLPPNILWCTDDDCLKHLRQHILGMTLPQLYLKMEGCWTGGHEENLRFPSANINHGPSSCEWWGLDSTQSLKLRDLVKKEKNFEIYSSETLWWPDEIYCIAKGFRLFHAIQLPGDLVIVGPGTIHWVKSLGVTSNSSWNFGPKYLNNFQKSFERDLINKQIGFRSLVPMNLLSLDLLNNELENLDLGLVEFLKKKVLEKARNDMEIVCKSGLNKMTLNNSDNVIHCEACYDELFRVYFKCLVCVEDRLQGGTKPCFFCFACMKNAHKTCQKFAAVEKFRQDDLFKLIQEVDSRCEGSFCKGNIESLKFPFDKNIEEGAYVSSFNGKLLEEQKKKTLKNESEKRTRKMSEMLKNKKKQENPEKLRSFSAKKREKVPKGCKKISDLHELLGIVKNKEEPREEKIEEAEKEKRAEIIFYKKDIQNVVFRNGRSEEYREVRDISFGSIGLLPMKRMRSANVYSPVADLIPLKHSG